MSPPPRLPWVLRHRRAALLLGIAAMLLGVVSALSLRPGTAVRDMLPAASPAAAALDRVFTDFRLIDDLMLLVELPAPSNAASPTNASNVLRLRTFAERVAEALRSDADIAYVRYDRADHAMRAAFLRDLAWSQAWWRLDDTQRQGVHERLAPGAMQEALARRAAELAAPGQRPAAWWDSLQRDPLGLLAWLRSSGPAPRDVQNSALDDPAHAADTPTLDWSIDGRALLIRIGGTRPANDLAYSESLVQRVNLAAEAANTDGLTWQLTGPYAIASFSASATKRDMIVSIFVSLGLLTLLFFVLYRDHRTLPMILFTVNGGIVVAFGIYALGRGNLSPVTATCGAVLAGLGIDYCVHLLAHARSRRPEHLAEALRVMTPTLGAACVTSAIGFAAVAASGVRALAEFAVLGVLGLTATLAMTLMFLPAALARPTDAPADEGHGDDRLSKWAQPLVSTLFVRPNRWLFVTAVIGGMAGAWLYLGGAQAVRFADDLEAMHAVPNPPLHAQADITERFGLRPSVLFVHLAAPDAHALIGRAAQLQAALDALQTDHPHIHSHWALGGVLIPTDATSDRTPPDAQEALAAFDDAVERSPFRPDAFAEFRRLLAIALQPSRDPPWDTLRGQRALIEPLMPRAFFEQQAPTQTLAIVNLDTPWELLDERSALLDDLRVAIADVPGATLTGLSVVGAEMQQALASVTQRLVWVAGLAVLAWLSLFFRNPWEVMAALFPAIVGLLVLYAAIGLLDIELHAANLIALPLTLGLGVDDGIFLVAVARRVRRSGGTQADLREGLSAATAAIVVTSVTTLVAFGSLAFTRTPAIQSLGLLSAVGIFACLVASLLGLIPALAMSHTRRDLGWRRK